MDVYTIVLFLHVAGALGFGASAFMSLFSLWALRRAQRTEEARSILGLLTLAGPVLGISMLVNLLAGLYMTADRWSWGDGWIIMAMLSVVLFIIAGAVMGIRRTAIQKLVNEKPTGLLSDTLVEHIHDPAFGTAIYMMLAIVMGIVYLMTDKPGLLGSIVVMVIAIGLGAAASYPMWRVEVDETQTAPFAQPSEGLH